jgi:hypothetical protein
VPVTSRVLDPTSQESIILINDTVLNFVKVKQFNVLLFDVSDLCDSYMKVLYINVPELDAATEKLLML